MPAKTKTKVVTSEPTLRRFMKTTLKIFNDEGVDISDSTVHKEVLSPTDGFGGANSMVLYQLIVTRRLFLDTGKMAKWPQGWMNKSVADLSPILWKSVDP